MHPAPREFGDLVDAFLTEEFEEEPVRASVLGAPGYDERLGDFSAAGFARRERRARDWLAAFSAMPDTGLDEDDRIDRDLAISALRGRTLLAERPAWRRDPATYLAPALHGVHALFLHRLRPEAELVAAAAARLRQLPDVIDHAIGNLDPELAPRLLAERAMDQARAAVRFVAEDVPGLTSDPSLRPRLRAAGAEAAIELQRFASWLEGFAVRAGGEWRLGERLYSALLTERELLGMDATGLHERGRRAYAEIDERMREVAARVPGGSADWRAVMEGLNRRHPPTMAAMLADYAAATAGARAFLAERGLVPFAAGEQCRVVPAPAYQRPVLAVASYFPLPALTDSRVGHFFVPFTPENASAEQLEQRLQTNSSASIPTIAAHETYPGHHWHRSWSAESKRPLRTLLGTPYFSEGWALYAERMMHEQGFFTDPGSELAHLSARAFRAARIIVDTALHAGDMSVEQAVDEMASRASLSRDTATVEVRRYCAWPTQAASYLTGSLEIERIRDEWRARHPGTPLAEFHAALAGSGSLPLGLAARAVL